MILQDNILKLQDLYRYNDINLELERILKGYLVSSFFNYNFEQILGPVPYDTIEEINLPNCKNIGSEVFSDQKLLSKCSLPECQSISNSAFQRCSFLTSINLPKCQTIGYSAFYSCTSLQSVSLPVCTSIEDYTFGYCSSLQSIDLPACTSIGISAFYRCTSLQSVSLPVCTLISDYAFAYCSSLQSIDLPSCTSVNNGAFRICTSLQSVSLPVCTFVGSYAFYNCTSLSSLDLPVCSFVTSGAFENCTSLQSVSLPVCTLISAYAFQNCTSLQSVSLPVCTLISAYAFQNCTSLQSVSLPVCTSVGSYAFEDCTFLQSVSLPVCTLISDYTFRDCTSLQSIDLPKCTTIRSNAFYQCSSLTTINLLGSSFCSIYSQTFNQTLFASNPNQQALEIKVFTGLLSTYLTNSVWAPYSQYIVPEEPRTPSFENDISFNIPINKTTTVKVSAILDVMPTNTTVTCNSSNVTISNIQAIKYNGVQFDVYTEVEENIQFTVTCNFEDFNSISTTINAVAIVYIAPTWEVEDLGTTYGFTLNANNYYESNNKNVHNSFAICKVNIDCMEDTIMYVDCINYAESNYDYGLLSLLDTELSHSSSADSSSVLKQSFKGKQSSSIQTVTYDVPAGEHFIFIKFIKDSSASSNNDSLQFTIRFAE